MRARSLVTTVAFLATTALSTSFAAKLVWDSMVCMSGGTVLQLISDGSGGCACVALVDGGTLYQISVFGKGGMSYFCMMRTTTECVDVPQLIGCSKKGMTFELRLTNGFFVMTVDAKRNVTTQETANAVLLTPCSNKVQQCYYDAKGFFVQRDQPLGDVFIQRYSY